MIKHRAVPVVAKPGTWPGHSCPVFAILPGIHAVDDGASAIIAGGLSCSGYGHTFCSRSGQGRYHSYEKTNGTSHSRKHNSFNQHRITLQKFSTVPESGQYLIAFDNGVCPEHFIILVVIEGPAAYFKGDIDDLPGKRRKIN